MAEVHGVVEELRFKTDYFLLDRTFFLSFFSSLFIANLLLLFRRSVYSIAKEMGVRKPTVTNVCRNWVNYGVVTRKPQGSKPRAIPADLLQLITGSETLEKQKFLSLRQRCTILFDQFGLKMSPHLLAATYRRAGIDYHRTRPQMRTILSIAEEQKLLRRQAARDVLNLMAGQHPVAFLDETSV